MYSQTNELETVAPCSKEVLRVRVRNFFVFLSGRVLRKLFFLFGVLRKNPSRFPFELHPTPSRAKKIFAPRFGVLDGVELRNKRWKLATVS